MKPSHTLTTITTTALLIAAAFVVFFWAGWNHMNKTLCNRGYSPEVYQEMKLDCTRYR
jgi:TRAP-type C4-dicarboxylate transport system permease small subunit